MGLPRRYADLASWYPLITSADEYEEEASFYASTIARAANGSASTLLELGCGSGSNAYHYKKRFTATLTDLSPAMLDLSMRINPECHHVTGDMRSLRLHETFDAVFVHDAIDYITTTSDLREVMRTAFVHLRPGGVALFAPDHVRENFVERVDHGGRRDNGRALRYMIWTYDPQPADNLYTYEFVYVMHEKGAPSRVVTESHECGLFSRNEWIDCFHDSGFDARAIPFPHSEEPEGSLEVFVAKKR